MDKNVTGAGVGQMGKLKVALYCSTKCHSKQFLDLVAAGFKRHGIKAEYHDPKIPIDCDLAVFWGHRQYKVMDKQRKDRKDYLVIERGYIGDRFQWTGMGLNGLNGRADFQANNMPGDRWQKYHADKLQPWKWSGKYILLIGQVSGDASVKGIKIHDWVRNMRDLARYQYPEASIRYRPHPIEVERNCVKTIDGVEMSFQPLEDDLQDAACVVTYNSNTGVDAILAGVPVVATDPGSMVYKIAMQNITDQPIRPDRTQWAHNMAYCQWLPNEIENGNAWEHLKQRYV